MQKIALAAEFENDSNKIRCLLTLEFKTLFKMCTTEQCGPSLYPIELKCYRRRGWHRLTFSSLLLRR